MDGDSSAWIKEALKNCKAMVTVFSSNSATSPIRKLELELAKANRIPVLPLLHSGNMKIEGVSPIMFRGRNDLHLSLKKICSFLITAGATSSNKQAMPLSPHRKAGEEYAQRALSADEESMVSSARQSLDEELSVELKRSLHEALNCQPETPTGTVRKTKSRSGSSSNKSSNVITRSQSSSANPSRSNSINNQSRSSSNRSSAHSRNGSMTSNISRNHSFNSQNMGSPDIGLSVPNPETLEEFLVICNLAHYAPALRELGAYTPADLEVH